MLSEAFMVGSSIPHRLDPRERLIFTLLFSIITAVSQQFFTLFAAISFSLFFIFLAELPLLEVARRLVVINVFNLILFLVLPLTYDGNDLFYIGTFTASKEGLLLAVRITLKSNAIVMTFIALIATMSIATLGNSLNRLRLPDEYLRLVTAMRARGFKPKSNVHTYRTYAYLFGMLLIKALSRADHVYQSMLCRGFKGKFYCLEVFSFSRLDRLWSLPFLFILLLLCSLEWLTTMIL